MSSPNPVLSIVVVVYAMADQAERTLRSLAAGYQRGVSPSNYEILVVENESDRLLGEERATRSGQNVRYFLRKDGSSSPASAVNFGALRARGRMLGIMVDGARLLSPGVVELALLTDRLDERAMLSVPGYHIGSELQQRAIHAGYDEGTEARLLSSISWPDDGYRLFDIACFSGSCAGGFLLPYAESNCLCLSKTAFERLDGFDERFRSRGGGYVNLDFYARAAELTESKLVVAPGEGTFHQFHGGITTGGVREDERERLMEEIHAEYESLRGHRFALPKYDAVYLGRIPVNARRFLEESLKNWSRGRGDVSGEREA